MAKRAAQSLDTDRSNDRDELAELKAQMAELQGRVQTAESIATDERGKRIRAEEAGMSEAERRLRGELSTAETAVTNLDSEADRVEAEIARLSDEPGNGATIAKLTRRMGEISADKRDALNRKAWLAGQVDQVKTKREAVPARGTEMLADGVTRLSDIPPESAAWARAHPKMLTDPVYFERVNATAFYAEKTKGLKPGTPDYYRFIENELGEGPADDRDDGEGDDIGGQNDRQTEQRRESPYSTQDAPNARQGKQSGDLDYTVEKPQSRAAGSQGSSAPPSRRVPEGSNGGQRRGGKIMLSSEQREVANSLYSHLPNEADRYERYAQNKQFMDQRSAGGFSNN